MFDKKRGKQKVEESNLEAGGSLAKERPAVLVLSALLIATAGTVLQIGGVSWDIMSHIQGAPETFFTAPHDILYTGVVLVAIGTGLLGRVLLKNRELRSKSFSTGFKLMIIGVCLDLVAGPSDFMWHEAFGLDGLLSPPHLTLITGMLLSSIGVTVALARISFRILYKQRMIKVMLVTAFAVLWFTVTWYINWFTLPSKFQIEPGQMFNFMLEPRLALVVATIATPLVTSLIFVTASKTIGARRFGSASAVVALVVVINTFASIVPTNGILMPSLLWYMISAIVPAVIADVILSKLIKSTKSKAIGIMEFNTIISGAIIGSVFYIMGFPILVWTFVEPLIVTPFDSMTELLPNFLNTLSAVLIFTLVVGATMGILGAWISSKITERIEIIA
jgi:hypothetical protein